MELEKRFDLLIQSANLAQQNGVLSLDDAIVVKTAVDNVKNKVNIEKSVNLLIKIAQLTQKKGVFSLRDAFYIFMAIDGIEDEIKNISPDAENKDNEVEDTKKGED